ncbi:MAG: DNA methyltransferase, partial [Nitrospinae bacterium]|nr:DNA methyltransferase [Nitrospinota bacterium]
MSAFTIYLSAVERALSRGDATEHTHRPALKTLVESFGKNVAATNEPKRGSFGAPDYLVTIGDIPAGHIEAKDVGVDLDKVADSEQLARYREGLTNLLLTDYLAFRWYRDGAQTLGTAVIARRDGKGKLQANPDGINAATEMIEAFLAARPPMVNTPKELAQRMARIARMMREAIASTLAVEKGDGPLTAQMEGFR